MPLTLAEARQSLRSYVKPPGATDATVDARINQVTERFISSGKWKGTLVTVDFAVYDGQVTLPPTLETILGITYDRTPRNIFPMWHAFVTNGPGIQDSKNLDYGIVDLGLGFPTFRDIPKGEYRELLATSRATEDLALNLRIVGRDEAGDPLYTHDEADRTTLGRNLKVNDAVDGDLIVSRIEAVNKPVTSGPITLSALEVGTGNETVLAVYEPWETLPSYRRYQVASNEAHHPITALCKRAHVAARRDFDPVLPGNTGALKLGLLALNYEDTNDLDRANAYWANAYALLNAETKEYLGPHTGGIQIQSMAWGGGDLEAFY